MDRRRAGESHQRKLVDCSYLTYKAAGPDSQAQFISRALHRLDHQSIAANQTTKPTKTPLAPSSSLQPLPYNLLTLLNFSLDTAYLLTYDTRAVEQSGPKWDGPLPPAFTDANRGASV